MLNFSLVLTRETVSATLGDRIKLLRNEAKISQQLLADRLGLKSKVSISDYETGKASPNLEDIQKLARLFRTTIDYLVTGENNNETKLMQQLRDAEKELEELKHLSYELLDNAEKFKQVAERQEKYKLKSSQGG
jgi:transcriptional regulator with XRE-family HTH domain